MKKFYLSLLPFVMAMFVCVGFASCSDDDDNEPAGPEAVEAITGQWEGKKIHQNAPLSNTSMTAHFYSDGTVEIWWTTNPLNATYYFSGNYTLTKKNIHFEGRACTNGSSLASGWEVNETSSYSIKNGVLKFKFDLKQDWELKAI